MFGMLQTSSFLHEIVTKEADCSLPSKSTDRLRVLQVGSLCSQWRQSMVA